MTKDDSRVDAELRKFLSQSYDYKSIADYFAGSDVSISVDEAINALATSKRFVAHFAGLIAP